MSGNKTSQRRRPLASKKNVIKLSAFLVRKFNMSDNRDDSFPYSVSVEQLFSCLQLPAVSSVERSPAFLRLRSTSKLTMLVQKAPPETQKWILRGVEEGGLDFHSIGEPGEAREVET